MIIGSAAGALIVGLALAAALGGDQRAEPPVADDRSPPDDPGLTTTVPEEVRAACEKLTQRYRGTVYCPPLLPSGKPSTQYVGASNRTPGDARSSYVLDFASSSLNEIDGASVDAYGGHWVVKAAPRTGLRDDVGLYVPRKHRRGRVKVSVREIAGVRVRLYRSADECCFAAYLAGHYTAVWTRDGVDYAVSIHGYRNRPRVLAMTRALLELQETCDTDAPPAGACSLAMGRPG